MAAIVSGQDIADVLSLTYASDPATFDQVADAADGIMAGLLSNADHSQHPWCREATLAVGTEMYQARTAVGGSPMAGDFTPGAYRLSVWLTRRVQTVVGRCWDMSGWVG